MCFPLYNIHKGAATEEASLDGFKHIYTQKKCVNFSGLKKYDTKKVFNFIDWIDTFLKPEQGEMCLHTYVHIAMCT